MKKIKKRIFIIAEAGVNHNGSLDIARKMVWAAASAGADAIKFQTFRAETLVTQTAAKAAYQKKNAPGNQSHFQMLKNLELDEAAHKELFRLCRKNKITFLSSPFDLDSIALLERLGLNIYKVPSGEIVNLPYLARIGSLCKKVILSTGMSVFAEIENALRVLVKSGTRKSNITVLHCVSEYPLAAGHANLKAMLAIKNAFGVNVGYSDHTTGIDLPIAAAALGACVIEKHFTLDKNMRGPDQALSVTPVELKRMVEAIRNVESGLGDGIKRPTRAEQKMKKVVRKSIIAVIDIPKGARITAAMLGIKRPGTGIAPACFNQVTGKIARRSIKQDTLIKRGDLK